MEPIVTINNYPIGWEWLDKVPLEDFTWLIEIFSTMTDNTDTYDFATFDKEATNGEPPYPVIEINRKGLANFLNEDQEINKNHLHSEFIRLRIREILDICLSDITIIDIIPLP